jgi:hypothetical protein
MWPPVSAHWNCIWRSNLTPNPASSLAQKLTQKLAQKPAP